MPQQRQSIPWVALFVMFAVGVAFAAGNDTNAQKSDLSKQDKKFVQEAAQGGMMEVQLGQYAADHASNAQVKSFGQRMVKDHTMINSKLMDAAQGKGVTIPMKLDDKHQDMVDKLKEKKNSDFDNAYIKAMIRDHKKDIKAFEKEAQNGQDAQIKDFAHDSLPTLKEHLQLAQRIEKQMGSNGAKE